MVQKDVLAEAKRKLEFALSRNELDKVFDVVLDILGPDFQREHTVERTMSEGKTHELLDALMEIYAGWRSRLVRHSRADLRWFRYEFCQCFNGLSGTLRDCDSYQRQTLALDMLLVCAQDLEDYEPPFTSEDDENKS